VKVGIETDAGLIEIGFGLDSSPSLLPSYFLHPRGEEASGKQIGEVTVAALHNTTTPTIAETGTVGPTVVYKNTPYEVRRLNELQWQESGTPSIVVLDGLLLKSITHERGTPRLLSGRARDELEFLFQNLTYLRATRSRPSRTYPAGSSARLRSGRALRGADSPQEIGYAGQWAAAVLHRRAEESVRYASLPSVPNAGEEMKLPSGQGVSVVSDTLAASVREWLQRLKLANSLRIDLSKRNPDRLEILVTLAGQGERNIVEIGFGTSQVFPILIAGLLQPPESLFIVDLPEAHLHPRPQSDLADFFCSLALSDRFSLVETHSEMFFHQLRLRAEMDDALKEKISVYFIDEPKDGFCCQPRLVGLGFDEQPRWPVGFLQEAWETESQIAEVRRAKARLKK
jgi:hypothetical protein